jgi:hypothetical protein
MVASACLSSEEAAAIIKAAGSFLSEDACFDEVRLIGACTSCGFKTFYCCYGSFSLGDSEIRRDCFLHFCTNCHHRQFEKKSVREDWECGVAGDDSAICPFCSYIWYRHELHGGGTGTYLREEPEG